VADGILLALTVGNQGQALPHYLPATSDNRDLTNRVIGGDPDAVRALDLQDAEHVAVHRPNIFALYERYIGPLTPLVAEQLRDAERSYPRTWIEEAIDAAVRYNRRNWRYVNAILRRWEEAGGQDSAAVGRR
jgi:DnaD/phage-associated family protein